MPHVKGRNPANLPQVLERLRHHFPDAELTVSVEVSDRGWKVEHPIPPHMEGLELREALRELKYLYSGEDR